MECSGVNVIIWDSFDLSAVALNSFIKINDRFPAVPKIALASFPRIQDVEMLVETGANVIISKPFFLYELSAALHKVTMKSTSSLRTTEAA
jgi:CheY-like chemotaxis protein